MKKFKRFMEAVGTVLMAILVVAVIVLLFISEMNLYEECQAEGHSFAYCVRLLSR